MRDRVDAMVDDDGGEEALVAKIALDEGGLRWHGPSEPGRQVVEHDDALAGVQQGQHHVSADVAGPTRHKNAHRPSRFTSSPQRRIASATRSSAVTTC